MHMTLAAALADDTWVRIGKDMFVVTVPILEKIARPVLVYFFLLIGLRLAGKRELAQLNPFDLIVLLTLSNTVQNAIIGDDNTVSGGMIGATALLLVNYIVVRTARSNKKLQRLLAGRADVLISDGKIHHDHLERELMTKADLLAAAHKQGIASLRDVERCVLEPTGTITFIPREPTHDVERHGELLGILNRLAADLAELRAERNGSSAIADPQSPPFNPGATTA